jgi:hypothetical protein
MKEVQMQISQSATKGHLIVGSILVLLSLGSLIASLAFQNGVFPFLVFFFGIWGGVELGRYLEHWMSLRTGESQGSKGSEEEK